ncbi:hypothetical protein EPI10_005489 [Gossypium australe]|uniref:Uncharacterized protein n=1 Tax=Gossypium australe TaxID=47621 RepID=A0A5B6WQ14_9ROSI|nr:hypothetical protein EPI10_005489 [Gossypium australe]
MSMAWILPLQLDPKQIWRISCQRPHKKRQLPSCFLQFVCDLCQYLRTMPEDMVAVSFRVVTSGTESYDYHFFILGQRATITTFLFLRLVKLSISINRPKQRYDPPLKFLLLTRHFSR